MGFHIRRLHASRHKKDGADELFNQNLATTDSVEFGEVKLTPKASSNGAEGTMYYDSDDDHVYIATE